MGKSYRGEERERFKNGRHRDQRQERRNEKCGWLKNEQKRQKREDKSQS